ncbi:magnesium transporter [Salmonella enterica subsp. enterica]|uniref:Protein MgtC n=1 Tax=Salmonella enterica I TaxID=59201 RepID=A0A3S5DMA2_SALET|nr:magnesium transporter [Salmonella enterica subsp. enterica]
MLMFPYILNLLAAMLLGALIGAERQWRQRMAGLRTNALVATGAAVFILSSMTTSPDSPGRIAAQIVSGIGFLGAGVIMREGMNVRGLNTAATLWCFGGHRRVMRLRAVQKCAGGDDHYSLRQYFIA